MPDVRLSELVVENFRSISGRCVIPLDASIILVHGANGAGKTSILSAIELAATGQIGFLEEQREDARALYRHQDFPLGSVRLSLADSRFGTRVGSFELSGDHVTGEAALTPTEQTYFRERSFLPQTALGRLLESYTETGKHVDTALVRFVKSLVGVDDLDALIDGLHASGDRRRSKKVVQAWTRGADSLDALRERRRRGAEQLNAAKAKLDHGANSLRELVGEQRVGGGYRESDVNELLRASVERSRFSDNGRAELARLAELQAMVDAITKMGQQAGGSLLGGTNRPEPIRTEGARAAFEAWKLGLGEAALVVVNRIRETSLGLPAVAIGQLADAFVETTERAVLADRQHAEALAVDRARSKRIDDLDEQIRDLDRRIFLAENEARAIDVSADVRVLIEILELAVPITHSDQCPICDEEFTGVGSLAEHFTTKLSRLSAHSTQLLAARQELTNLQSERLAKIQQVVLQKSLPALAAGRPMDEAIRSLNDLRDSIAEGSELQRNLQSEQASIAEAAAQGAHRAIVADRIAQVAEAIGLSFGDLPAEEPDVELGREIAKRVQEARRAEVLRDRERGARIAIEDAQRDMARSEREMEEVEREISVVEAQLSTAESRMMSARQLLQTAERTRSKLINDVFDQSLNSLWAQLFGRFAPSERFTPRFVKQTEASRSVDVSLETELPGGLSSGSPGAMLSYGNTNSAALSLFIALHLSAPSELEWLLFDDPVQSMDDIHVANFAAIVRQLAFVHQRQIVIAIHQPELFDYLSLALSPSDVAQSLVRVTLDRGTGTTVAHVDRVEFTEEPVLYRAT